MNHSKSVEFYQISECQAPYLKLSGDGSESHLNNQKQNIKISGYQLVLVDDRINTAMSCKLTVQQITFSDVLIAAILL